MFVQDSEKESYYENLFKDCKTVKEIDTIYHEEHDKLQTGSVNDKNLLMDSYYLAVRKIKLPYRETPKKDPTTNRVVREVPVSKSIIEIFLSKIKK